jgi:predicted aspartyl protease
MPEAKCGFDDDHRGTGSELLVQLGPTLVVDIGFDPDFDPVIGGAPSAQLKGSHALVDTGATESCIDAAVAAALNLPIVDRRNIAGVGGIHEVNLHLAQIYIPELDFTIYGRFAAVNLQAGGQPHVVLIGRTFLRHVTLTYDGATGQVNIRRP